MKKATMSNSKLLLFVFVLSFFQIVHAQTRTEITLTNHWKFYKGKVVNAHQQTFDDLAWENVTVPHNWAIKGPFDKEVDKQTVAIVQNGDRINCDLIIHQKWNKIAMLRLSNVKKTEVESKLKKAAKKNKYILTILTENNLVGLI